MKYTNTTQEQRKDITPYLKDLFEEDYEYGSLEDIYRDDKIEGFQQAQKEEINRQKIIEQNITASFYSVFEITKINDSFLNPILQKIKEDIKKLKFESELE